jgi:hypothetical protein
MTREEKHKEALFRYYDFFGLNDSSIKSKIAHWERQGCQALRASCDKQKLMIYEIGWLVEQFPQDFNYC